MSGYRSWNSSEVAEWVNNMGPTFGPLSERFQELSIDGGILASIEEEDLQVDFGRSVETSILWTQISQLTCKSSATKEISNVKRKKADSPFVSKKKARVIPKRNPVFEFCTDAPKYKDLPAFVCNPLPAFDVNSPETVVVRNTKNIAWNLAKEKLKNHTLFNERELKFIYGNLKHGNDAQGTYRHNQISAVKSVFGVKRGFLRWKHLRAEMEQAKALKKKCLTQLHEQRLPRLLNKVTGDLGLCGPPESNIRRSGDKIAALHPESFQFAKDGRKASVYHILKSLQPNIEEDVFDAIDYLFDPCYDFTQLVQTILSFTDGYYDFLVTAEGSLGHLSTGCKCLDFYANQKPDETKLFVESYERTLSDMWEEHGETCLKIIFHLGAAREGKQDRWTFYACCMWLWENHPFSLIKNLEHVPEVNYYKALLEILVRITEGEKWFKDRTAVFKRKKKANSEGYLFPPPKLTPLNKVQAGEKVLFLFDNDPVYRLLHKKIASIFAKALRKDLRLLSKGARGGYSLAAKWVPTVDSPYDDRTLICESIARNLFPRNSSIEYQNITEFQYNYRIRKRLRKEVLSPLREKLRIVEKLVSSNRFSEVQYSAVPSLAMKKHTKTFKERDTVRFEDFLQKLEKGEVKVNVGAGQPYEILAKALGDDRTEAILAEGQWRELVKKTKQKLPENLRNCIASVDTSGSMYEEIKPGVTRLNVAISLALLISEINDGPYQGICLTFSDRPKLVAIQGETLKEKYEWFTKGASADWGFQTNLKNLFGTLLDNKDGFGVPARVIILSDMEFSDLSTPDYLRRLKREKGNTSSANEMVVSLMWNTKDDLDLHCKPPTGREIYYSNRTSGCGTLDVDMNAGRESSREPVENIFFTKGLAHGQYDFIVENYSYKQTQSGLPINWRLTFRLGNMVHHEMGTCVGQGQASHAHVKFNYTGLKSTYWGECPATCEPQEQFSDDYLETWTTEFQSIKRRYNQAGCELPKVVFWNLGDDAPFPVAKSEPGTMLVSGFASTTLNTILQNGKVDPISNMIDALNTGVLENIRVVNDMSDIENIVKSVK